MTADGFQIFCFTCAGKWSPELWFGSPHGKSTVPFGQRWCGLTGCLLASAAPSPVQQSPVEGGPVGQGLAGPVGKWAEWQLPPAAARACSVVDAVPSSTPREEDRRLPSNPQPRESSIPPPEGREQKARLSLYMEPRAWNPCLGHAPALLPCSSEALPAADLGPPAMGQRLCEQVCLAVWSPCHSSPVLSRGLWWLQRTSPTLASLSPPAIRPTHTRQRLCGRQSSPSDRWRS